MSGVISNIPDVKKWATGAVVAGSILACKGLELVSNKVSEFCTFPMANSTVSLDPKQCIGKFYSDRTVYIPLLGNKNYAWPIAATVATVATIAIPVILKNKELIASQIPDCIKKPLVMLRDAAKSCSIYALEGAIGAWFLGIDPLTGTIMAVGTKTVYDFACYITQREDPNSEIAKLKNDVTIAKQQADNFKQISSENGKKVSELEAKYTSALQKLATLMQILKLNNIPWPF